MAIDKSKIKPILEGQSGQTVADNILANFNYLADNIDNKNNELTFFGIFESSTELPKETVDGFAYVGKGTSLYHIWNYKKGIWTDSNKKINISTPITPPNNEDIDMSSDNKLQFANKNYTKGDSGLGRIYVRRNKVGADNVIKQKDFPKANTIYILQYDYKVVEPIRIPEGCVLECHGTRLRGGSIDLNNVQIFGDIVFDITMTVTGKIKNIKGIEPEMFGYEDGDGTSEIEKIQTQSFLNYVKYVNETPTCYFQITDKGYYYHLYTPFYSEKSIIGVNNPRFMYMNKAIGKTVPSDKTTPEYGERFDNVKAVFAVNQTGRSDIEFRFTIKNLRIYCNQGDASEGAARQDIGFYFPEGNNFCMENVAVLYAGKYSFQFIVNWMSTISLLNSWNCKGTGFMFHKDGYQGTFTSLHVASCYSHTSGYQGFRVSGAHYSTFQDLGNDSCSGYAAYCFTSCYGTNFMNLGSEGCNIDKFLYIGDLTGRIDGIFTVGNTIKDSYFNIFAACKLTISGIHNTRLTKGNSNAEAYRIRTSSSQENRVTVFDSYSMACQNEESIGLDINSPNGFTRFIEHNGESRLIVDNKTTFNHNTLYGTYDERPSVSKLSFADIGKPYYITEYNMPVWYNGETWINSDGKFPRNNIGSTSDRPVMIGYGFVDGFLYYDTTLKKPIFWNSTDKKWYDAAGQSV